MKTQSDTPKVSLFVTRSGALIHGKSQSGPAMKHTLDGLAVTKKRVLICLSAMAH